MTAWRQSHSMGLLDATNGLLQPAPSADCILPGFPYLHQQVLSRKEGSKTEFLLVTTGFHLIDKCNCE